MIVSVANASKQSAEMALEFVIKEHEAIGQKLGGWPKHAKIIGWSLLPQMAGNFASDKIGDRIIRFYTDYADVFKQHPYLDQSIAKIQQNQRWLLQNQAEACDWFKAMQV